MKKDTQCQRDTYDNRIDCRKLEVGEVYVDGRMRRGSSIRVHVSKQSVADAHKGLIFPGVTAHWPLRHAGRVVFQHSDTPLLEIQPRSFPSAERCRQNEKQKYQRHEKTCGRLPVTP